MKTKSILSPLLLAALALHGAPLPRTEDAIEAAELDARDPGLDELHVAVLTFNIRYGTADDGEDRWEKRRGLVFDVIREQDPDVIGLQEALRFQIDEIRAAVPRFREVGVGRDDGDRKGEYSAILYRTDRFRLEDSGTFWLSDTPEVPGSKSWGNRIPRICTWALLVDQKSGAPLEVYNLHLDHESQPSRERSADLLLRRLAERERIAPFVITGDFNAGEDNPALLALRGDAPDGARPRGVPRLVDTFRAATPEGKEAGTFHAFRGGMGGEKIDHILVPDWVGTESAEILRTSRDGRYPSDHFPVAARIRVPRLRES